MDDQIQTTTQRGTGHGSLRSYVIGFALSIILTLVVYYLVDSHVHSGHETFSHEFLHVAVVILAILQLAVQLVFFLHLGKKSSQWNLIAFLYTALLVVFLAGGSLWIMNHLNYNMMLMSPSQSDSYMLDHQ